MSFAATSDAAEKDQKENNSQVTTELLFSLHEKTFFSSPIEANSTRSLFPLFSLFLYLSIF